MFISIVVITGRFMKIAIAGLGYVGLSNAIVLSKAHDVVVYDVSEKRVNDLNNAISPVDDKLAQEMLTAGGLALRATTRMSEALNGAGFVIVATPTNYDPKTNQFDTSSVETVIEGVIQHNPKAAIVIKSTIPIGYVERLREKYAVSYTHLTLPTIYSV